MRLENIPGEATSEPDDRTTGRTVLVAEDDADVLRLISTVLRMNGYRVLEASDGVGALQILVEEFAHIEAVFCDQEMPRMDGSSALHIVKRLLPEAGLLLTSGHPDFSPSDALAPVLRKPWTPKQLLAAIESLFPLPEDQPATPAAVTDPHPA